MLTLTRRWGAHLVSYVLVQQFEFGLGVQQLYSVGNCFDIIGLRLGLGIMLLVLSQKRSSGAKLVKDQTPIIAAAGVGNLQTLIVVATINAMSATRRTCIILARWLF